MRKDPDEQSVCVVATDVGQVQAKASAEPMTWGGTQPQGAGVREGWEAVERDGLGQLVW